MSTHHLSDRDLSIYRQGMDEGRAFRHGSHLLHQDMFRAETPDHRIYIGYDDVDEGIYMTITFKNWWREGEPVKVDLRFRNMADAMARVVRFFSEHGIENPTCTVDY